MKVKVDTIWRDKLEITVNKAEMMEIYRAIAKAEHGDRIILDSGLVIKVEYTKEELERWKSIHDTPSNRTQ